MIEQVNVAPVATPSDATPLQIEPLTQQLVVSITRLVDLEGRRVALTEQIKASGNDPALRQRLVAVTSEISGEKAKLAELKARIEEAKQTLPPAFPIVANPPDIAWESRVFGMNKNESTFVFFLSLPVIVALCVKFVQRRKPVRQAAPLMDDNRLARLEQAVESVAIEVERIGESQRFQARLMAEKQPVERA